MLQNFQERSYAVPHCVRSNRLHDIDLLILRFCNVVAILSTCFLWIIVYVCFEKSSNRVNLTINKKKLKDHLVAIYSNK